MGWPDIVNGDDDGGGGGGEKVVMDGDGRSHVDLGGKQGEDLRNSTWKAPFLQEP